MFFKKKDKTKDLASPPVKSSNRSFSLEREDLGTLKRPDPSKENLLKNGVDTSFVYYEE